MAQIHPGGMTVDDETVLPDLSHQQSLLDAALSLHEAGFAVVVIPAKGTPLKNGRTATGKGPSSARWQTACLTPAALRRAILRSEISGIGVVSGSMSGGLLLLDFDLSDWQYAYAAVMQDGFPEWQTTRQVCTGSGRMHVWLRCRDIPDDFNNRSFVRGNAKIELRANGSQSLVPPSLHPDTGNPYEWVDEDAELAEVSFSAVLDWLCDWANVIPDQRQKHRQDAPEKKERQGALLPVTSRTKQFLAGLAPVGEQRTRALSACRNLLSSGRDASEVTQMIFDGLSASQQGKAEPWTLADAEQIVGSLLSAPEPPVPDYMLDPPVTLKLGPNSGGHITVEGNAVKDEAESPDKKHKDEGAGRHDFVLAEEWARKVRGELCFVEGEQWWQYHDGYWSHSSSATARKSVQEFLAEKLPKLGITRTPARVRDVMFLAESMLGPIPLSDFNAHPNWIPLKNGVYDTNTDTLIPHSPGNRVTYILPYDYDPFASCPLWEEKIKEWLITTDGDTCKEWIEALQQWIGYCLIPDNSLQVSQFWTGSGANGKGTVTRVVEKLIGPENITSISIDQLHDPYHRAELHGKQVGFVNEPDPKSMSKNSSMFKAITGGDRISARRPTEKVFTFVPLVRIILSCNALPATKDFSHGYFRRIIIIEWRYQCPEDKKDVDLDEKLRGELSGIFNWALEGLKTLRDNGMRFQVPEESKILMETYKTAEDATGRFFDEETIKDPKAITPAKTLFREYRTWCDDFNLRPVTETMFGVRLRKNGYVSERSYATELQGQVRSWVGIRMKTKEDK